MRERLDRRWGQFTREEVQQIADRTPFEQYSKSGLSDGDYMPAFTERLTGKDICIRLDNGDRYRYRFYEGQKIIWSVNDGAEKEDKCLITEAPGEPDIFFLQHYCDKSAPPEAHTLVLDCTTGLVTMCIAVIGNQSSAREVSRCFLFGIMEGYEDTGKRHEITDELVGTSIYWTYFENPRMRVKHIYTAPKYYTYQMDFGEDKCWVASNPADYVKINDHMFIFAFIEERQTGAQGLFLINREMLHDVGAFFSVSARGIESAVVGAKGELTDPYAYEWCWSRE